jgi:hypothetical protein
MPKGVEGEKVVVVVVVVGKKDISTFFFTQIHLLNKIK